MQQLTNFKKTELGEMPEEWEYTELEKLAEQDKSSIKMGPFGSSLKKHELLDHGKIRVLWIENIVNNEMNFEYEKYITNQKYQELRGFTIKPQDVLITMMGTLGRIAVVPDNIGTAIISSHLLKISLDKNKCIPEFLYYFLLSDEVKKQLNRESRGIVMQGLNTKIVKAIRVKLPSLHEQQKIASILSKVDELIQKTDQIIEQTQRLKKGLVNKLVAKGMEVLNVKNKEVPEKHTLHKLSEVTSINPKYRFDNNKEYPFVEMAALNQATKTIDYYGRRKPSSGYAIFKNQDTLFARITPCTENGKICLVTELSDIGIGSTEFLVLSPKDKLQLSPEFLYYYCQTDIIRNYAISQMRGATGRQRVPDSVFTDDLFITLPKVNIQKESIETIKNIESILKIHKREKKEYEDLKKGIMQQLLTGKIRVKV